MPKLQIQIPAEFICPLTNALMADPVATADGAVYERAAIGQWLKKHDTNPITQRPLTNKILVNAPIKIKIQAFIEQHHICSQAEFMDAVVRGDAEAIKKLNYTNSHIHGKNIAGNTALHLASRQHSNSREVKLLLQLEAKADDSFQDFIKQVHKHMALQEKKKALAASSRAKMFDRMASVQKDIPIENANHLQKTPILTASFELEEIIKKANEGGSDAMFLLAEFYETQQNATEALFWYEQSAERGYAPARHNLGLIYYEQKLPHYELACNHFVGAARLGAYQSAYNAAMMYQEGIGLKEDEEKAAGYYRLALKLAQGIPDAMAKAYDALEEMKQSTDITKVLVIPNLADPHRLNSTQEELKKKELEVNALKEDKAKMEKKLQGIDENISQAKTLLENKEREYLLKVADYDQQLESLEKEKNDLTHTYETIHQTVKESEDAHELLKRTQHLTEEELSLYKKDLEEKTKQLQEVKKKLGAYEIKIDNLKKKQKENKKRYEEKVSHVIEEKKQVVDKLETDIGSARKEKEQIEKEMKQLYDKHTKLLEEGLIIYRNKMNRIDDKIETLTEISSTTMRQIKNEAMFSYVANCRIDIIQSYLADKDANVNLVDAGNKLRSLLQTAVLANHVVLVDLLLKAGAKPNYQDEDKCTALYYALKNENKKIIDILIHYGADPNQVHAGAKLDISIAASNSAHSTLQTLQKATQVTCSEITHQIQSKLPCGEKKISYWAGATKGQVDKIKKGLIGNVTCSNQIKPVEKEILKEKIIKAYLNIFRNHISLSHDEMKCVIDECLSSDILTWKNKTAQFVNSIKKLFIDAVDYSQKMNANDKAGHKENIERMSAAIINSSLDSEKENKSVSNASQYPSNFLSIMNTTNLQEGINASLLQAQVDEAKTTGEIDRLGIR